MARKRPAARKAKLKARKKVSFIPRGYHSVTPYLACKDAAGAIEFYRKAFGAAEVMRMPAPGGKIGHAEIRIGDSRVMLTDEYPEMDFLSPQTRGGTTVHIHVYVRGVDAMVERAVAAGAKLLREVKDQFYGDRSGSLQDPFGHVWHLATHVRDLSPAALRKGAEQAMKDMAE
jgi:PhnB protein